MIKLIPGKNKHYKNIENGDIYEGTIYLSVYDSVDNYVEVSEEEYQASLKPTNKLQQLFKNRG